MDMRTLRQSVLVVAVLLTVTLVGCNKQTTTTGGSEAPPPPPPVEVVEDENETMEPMPLSDDAVFEAMDMDAEMQEVFQTVYFDFDKYGLREETTARLQIIAPYLQEHPSIRVLAEGHCDEPGSSEYNIGLGENRAKAIKDYLTGYGISGNRIEMTSYGKERPAFPNCGDDEDCHARNRRVEWKILSK